MDEREFEEVLASYEGLFRGVLFKCHIYKNNSSYEDYLQQMRLLFFELTNQSGTSSDFKKRYPIGFLFQRLVWKVRDLQRIDKRQVDIEQRVILYYQESVSYSIQEEIESMNLFETVWCAATTGDKEFLYALLQEKNSGLLARKYQVSTQTIRNKKKRLVANFLENK